MSDDAPLFDLLSSLSAATSFEEAADALLKTALAIAQGILASSVHAHEARLLRGIVYLRPVDGYQRLVGIEFPSGKPTGSAAYLTSATAWRWMVEHQTQVSIDVHRGALLAWSGDSPTVLRDAQGIEDAPSDKTRDSLLSTRDHPCARRAIARAGRRRQRCVYARRNLQQCDRPGVHLATMHRRHGKVGRACRPLLDRTALTVGFHDRARSILARGGPGYVQVD